MKFSALRKKLRFDVVAPLALSAVRPLSYSLGVVCLAKMQGGKEILQAFALLGVFSILDALMQGYARGRALYSNTEQDGLTSKASWALSILVGTAVFCSIYFFSVLAVAVSYSVLTVNFLLLRYERATSTANFVKIWAGLELCILAVASSISLANGGSSVLGLVPLFISAPLSRILSLAFISITRSQVGTTTPAPPSSTQTQLQHRRILTYLSTTALTQIVCAATSLLPIGVCTAFNAEAALPKCMLVVRWISTIGAAASTLVNIFSARIFYGDISGKNLAVIVARVIFHHGKFFVPLYVLLTATTALWLTGWRNPELALYALVTTTICLTNFLSSSFQALRLPLFSFWAQLHVSCMTALATFVAAGQTAPTTIALAVAPLATAFVYRRFRHFNPALHQESAAKQ